MSDKNRYRNPFNGNVQELTPAVARIFGYEPIEDDSDETVPALAAVPAIDTETPPPSLDETAATVVFGAVDEPVPAVVFGAVDDESVQG